MGWDSTKDVHKNPGDTHFSIEENSNQASHLHSRHSTGGRLNGGDMPSKEHNNFLIKKPGLLGKLQEINVGANTNIGIPGSNKIQYFNDFLSPKRENKEIREINK